MGTSFREIINIAHTTLYQNYKLDNLISQDEDLFYQFLSGILVNSTNMFNGALDNLSFHEEVVLNSVTMKEETQYVFDRELTSKEKYILALGVSIGLYKRELDDVTVYSNHLSSKNFKEVANAQNLKAREERLMEMQEELNQEIVAMQLNAIPTNGMSFFGGV